MNSVNPSSGLEGMMILGPISAAGCRRRGFARPTRSGGLVLSVQASGCRPELNLLYAIAGTLDGIHSTKVDRTLLQVTLDQRQHSLPLLD